MFSWAHTEGRESNYRRQNHWGWDVNKEGKKRETQLLFNTIDKNVVTLYFIILLITLWFENTFISKIVMQLLWLIAASWPCTLCNWHEVKEALYNYIWIQAIWYFWEVKKKFHYFNELFSGCCAASFVWQLL